MRVVVCPKPRNGTVAVVHITGDMEVTSYTDGPVVAELEKAAALVNQPKLTAGCGRGHLLDGEDSSDNHALLDIAFLRDKKHLVAWGRRAYHSPAISDPLGHHRQPPRQNSFGLNGYSRRGVRRVDRCDSSEFHLAGGLIQTGCMRFYYVRKHSIHNTPMPVSPRWEVR